jgi:tRNA G10  N-methylase Trm11
MPTYLVRLAQAHESFRKVELQALADLAGITLEFLKYDEDVGNSKSSMQSLFFSKVHTLYLKSHTQFVAPFTLHIGPNLHSPLIVS